MTHLPAEWIGLVHVRAAPESRTLSEGAKGAYGNIAALAFSKEHFREVVQRALEKEELVIVEIEDIDTADGYKAKGRYSDYLDFLVNGLSEDHPVQMHTLYNYLEDE